MPKYTFVLSKKAQKQLNKLSDHIAEAIMDAIAGLEENPWFGVRLIFVCQVLLTSASGPLVLFNQEGVMFPFTCRS